MDPQLQNLAIQLADVTIRNTAGSIVDRIKAAEARKKEGETIAELEEIINELISDKSELVRIAQAYEEEFVAQRISPTDIEYISTNLVPLVQQLVGSAAASSTEGASAQRVIDIMQPLLSVETVTVLQLLGFNFRKAVGEPLTDLVGTYISSRMKANSTPERKAGTQRTRAR